MGGVSNTHVLLIFIFNFLHRYSFNRLRFGEERERRIMREKEDSCMKCITPTPYSPCEWRRRKNGEKNHSLSSSSAREWFIFVRQVPRITECFARNLAKAVYNIDFFPHSHRTWYCMTFNPLRIKAVWHVYPLQKKKGTAMHFASFFETFGGYFSSSCNTVELLPLNGFASSIILERVSPESKGN